MGYAIQADEEQLRVHLEKIQAELNHPTQFKVRNFDFCIFNHNPI
jgi:nuclear pore complex protein Nup54